jgi:hypothetical protein
MKKPAGEPPVFVTGCSAGEAGSVADPDALDDQIAVIVVFADLLDPAMGLVIAVVVVALVTVVVAAMVVVAIAAIITASLGRSCERKSRASGNDGSDDQFTHGGLSLSNWLDEPASSLRRTVSCPGKPRSSQWNRVPALMIF